MRNDNFFCLLTHTPPLICLQTKENSAPREKFCPVDNGPNKLDKKYKKCLSICMLFWIYTIVSKIESLVFEIRFFSQMVLELNIS